MDSIAAYRGTQQAPYHDLAAAWAAGTAELPAVSQVCPQCGLPQAHAMMHAHAPIMTWGHQCAGHQRAQQAAVLGKRRVHSRCAHAHMRAVNMHPFGADEPCGATGEQQAGELRLNALGSQMNDSH
jgi:hypothetical protein